MIRRSILSKLKQTLGWQAGKTTLAWEIGQEMPSLYLDLESPEDRNKLNDPILF